MARFQGGNDSFGGAADLEGGEDFVVVAGDIFHASDFFEPCVFGPGAGVVQPRGDGVRLGDLPVVVLEVAALAAVENAGGSGGEGGGVLSALDAGAARFHADHSDFGIVQEGVKESDGVGAAADAGDKEIGQGVVVVELLGELRAGFVSDDALEFAHHFGVGVRSGDAADDIEGVVYVRHPVAEGFVHRVLEGGGAGVDGFEFGAEQPHSEGVGRLAFNVFASHVDDAGQADSGACGGGGDAVLSGAGFGDDSGFARFLGEEDLSEDVVDFVGAGVVEFVAFEPDSDGAGRAAGVEFGGEAFCFVEGRGTPGVVFEELPEFVLEIFIIADFVP